MTGFDSPHGTRQPDRRISRAGSALILVGLMMVVAAVGTAGYNVYSLLVLHTFNGRENDLLAGYSGLLAGFGVLLAAVGWVLDQGATRRALLTVRSEGATAPWIPGLIITFTGVAVIVGSQLFSAGVAFSFYYALGSEFSSLTIVIEYAGLAVGILILGIGWFIHHWFSLNRIESTFR